MNKFFQTLGALTVFSGLSWPFIESLVSEDISKWVYVPAVTLISVAVGELSKLIIKKIK